MSRRVAADRGLISRSSTKTVSKKAMRRVENLRASVTNTPTTSPPHSQASSRYASEVSDGSDSEFDDDDDMTMSTNSVSDHDLDAGEDLAERVHRLVAELQNRKFSRHTLSAYLHVSCHYFTGPYIEDDVEGVVAALLGSINDGGLEEQLLGLKALAVTSLTCPDGSFIYKAAFKPLKFVCQDTETPLVKAQAIHTMAITTLYGGGDEDAINQLLEFLLKIIQSDGKIVNAKDNGMVVVAALEAWAFVATQLDDLGDYKDESEAFQEQLESTDTGVQVAAGVNMALLLEISRLHQEEAGQDLGLPFDREQIIHRLSELSRGSKHMSRKDRGFVRTSLTSVRDYLKYSKGSGYSAASTSLPAINPSWSGSSVEIRVNDSILTMHTWALQIRFQEMHMLLGAGFLEHFKHNPTLQELLSEVVVESWVKSRPLKGKPKKKGRT